MTTNVTRSSKGQGPNFRFASTDRTGRAIESEVRVLDRTQSGTAQWVAFRVALMGGADHPVQSEWAEVLYRPHPETGQRSHLTVHAFEELPDETGAEARTAIPPPSAPVSFQARYPVGAFDAGAGRTELGATPRTVQGRLEHLVERLFQAARDEYFEDGMETSFSKGFSALVVTYGETDDLKVLLAYWVLLGKTPPHVICEALRCLGRTNHAPSHRYRRWLLERCLKSPSPAIRDSAGLGLSYLDDPGAVPALTEAAQRETRADIREGFLQVLAQFQR